MGSELSKEPLQVQVLGSYCLAMQERPLRIANDSSSMNPQKKCHWQFLSTGYHNIALCPPSVELATTLQVSARGVCDKHQSSSCESHYRTPPTLRICLRFLSLVTQYCDTHIPRIYLEPTRNYKLRPSSRLVLSQRN